MKKSFVLALLGILCVFSLSWADLPPSRIAINKYDHFITAVLKNPGAFMLEDGSVWRFGTKNRLNKKMKIYISTWKEGQPVEFSHEKGIFKSSFYIHNLETGDKVETELLTEATDELALYVEEFDINSRMITLSDDSRWILDKKNCTHCLSRIKQRFINKMFVAREFKSEKFYLITSNSILEHVEVIPAF